MSGRLGKWLALHRGERCLSLRAAGAIAGASHVYLSEIERGKGCSASKAIELADAYGASLDEAARLWTLDRIEAVEREAHTARHQHRMSLVLESHRGGE